jgi:dTDP-4-amino-4,6-dideoxygalactose transaminase
MTIDPHEVEIHITNKTKAIIPVHLYGQSCDINSLRQIAKKYNLTLIEDACQAIGATTQNKYIGTLGDTGCFSFFPSKNLGGFGDGGLVTTNNPNLYQKLIDIRNHGSSERYHHYCIGGNFRMDTLQAALLRIKLKYLDNDIKKRRKNAALYAKGLEKVNCRLPQEIRHKHTWNQYTIKTSQRDALQKYLSEQSIDSAIYYPVPLHKQQCFSNICDGIFLHKTEKASKEVLSLPIAAEITSEQIYYVIKTIKTFFNN